MHTHAQERNHQLTPSPVQATRGSQICAQHLPTVPREVPCRLSLETVDGQKDRTLLGCAVPFPEFQCWAKSRESTRPIGQNKSDPFTWTWNVPRTLQFGVRVKKPMGPSDRGPIFLSIYSPPLCALEFACLRICPCVIECVYVCVCVCVRAHA